MFARMWQLAIKIFLIYFRKKSFVQRTRAWFSNDFHNNGNVQQKNGELTTIERAYKIPRTQNEVDKLHDGIKEK